ncbi:hypothetical protein AS034_02045 [[Bacillus] enclensis]|uniref:Uncharacterized protein n=1 Tax=[Bacillus] enclensis TaxID=1402860 RepID=A0A0V8HR41_9BACI|nr:hypothetical protein [[Bacillus] enclensis]KSU64641.1 hypothetical protein AS034_02045 [[Bacillus] enclensis]SCB77510.1 hypothetical protein GA0061094_0425 [[Bacillus] enclensis]
MAFFSKLFGKSRSPKQPKGKDPSYFSTLELFIIYKGDADSDSHEDDVYTKLEDEFWGYRSLGESGVMSSYWAKDYGVPLPAFPKYPLIGVFKLTAYKGVKEGYKHPLFISSNKEEVKKFFEEYEKEREQENLS